MTAQETYKARRTHFEKLYNAFLKYFGERLKADGSDFTKYKLQLEAEFFDNLELQKVVFPLFSENASTINEKRACARAALWDALVLHKFSDYMSQAEKAVWDSLKEIHSRIDYLMENQDARSKRS